ncbi:2'-5' RNA ligase [Kribbella sp. VKM Ac-2569]|uniref:2'-5' RNA ligase family protein n=1 Tax=Kribbella sp. VKM Ac-2569 TaxID=2512220 RepID=UPI00102CD2B7|nr:2'-5' RNA ligase family protein [Kribbella sp. VKM Ac-2569]RZT13480.1 2'-5' RNA ligase [Kribbella sp. VKM Ac-2569]
MALAVCLLFDRRTDRLLRALWDRLENLGVPTLKSHTHRRHVPHLSLAVLREWDHDRVQTAVQPLLNEQSAELYFDALGTFRRGRAWLVPAVGVEVLQLQATVVSALRAADAELHRHYQPGRWVPHCTLAPRVPLAALPVLAAAVYDVLPLEATADHAALIDSSTGQLWPLTYVV